MTSPQNLTLAKEQCRLAPPLEARLAPWQKNLTLVENRQVLQGWLTQQDSPLHVFVLDQFHKNIEDLTAPLDRLGIRGKIFFARKANKLGWFVKAAGHAGIGVDTASANEVKETLELGLKGSDIVVTAVGKTESLVELSIKEDCLLVIDNLDELALIESVAARLGKTARCGLRFSGFKTEERVIRSRFGFPIEDASSLARKVASSQALSLEVFHAHIDKYSPRERAMAAFAMIDLIKTLKADKIEIRSIDLGGGILISYLEEERQWLDYLEALQDSVRGTAPSFNYGGEGFGYYLENGVLKGEPDLYPHYNEIPKGRFVQAILEEKNESGPLAKQLQELSLEVSFEPGRALLDNTGVTITSVGFRKEDTTGNTLIGLNANRMNLRPFRAEFCVDPIHLPVEGELKPGSAHAHALTKGAFLVGCLCSESDFIMRRRLALASLPAVGDIFLFPNTAGYLAHHMEIGTHGGDLPTNILIDGESLEIRERA